MSQQLRSIPSLTQMRVVYDKKKGLLITSTKGDQYYFIPDTIEDEYITGYAYIVTNGKYNPKKGEQASIKIYDDNGERKSELEIGP